MSNPDTFDQMQANAEGWGIFNAGVIQRLDSGPHVNGEESDLPPSFAGDQEALDYVRLRASEGSVYHQQALLTAGDWAS